jgi:hypothetical protein
VVAVVLGAFLVTGVLDGSITPLGVGALAVMGAFLIGVLHLNPGRYRYSLLRPLLPATPLNAPHYAALALLFLVAAAVGYLVPAIGTHEAPMQITALITLRYLLGFAWTPVVSVYMAVRAFVDISQEEG